MNHLLLCRVCASVIVLSACAGVQAAVLTPLKLVPFYNRTQVNPPNSLFVDYAVTSGGGGTSGTGLLTVAGGTFNGGFVSGPISFDVDLDDDATALDGNAIDNETFNTTGTIDVSIALVWDTVAGTVGLDSGNAANALTVTADMDPATNAPGDLGVETLFHIDVGTGVGDYLEFGGGTDTLELMFTNGIDLTAYGLTDMILNRIGGLILNTGTIYDSADTLIKAPDDPWTSTLFAADFSNAQEALRQSFGAAPLGSAIIFIPEPTALGVIGVLTLSALVRRRRCG